MYRAAAKRPDGEGRLVGLRTAPGQRYSAVVFDSEDPWGRPWPAGEPLRLGNGLVDADGDGRWEQGPDPSWFEGGNLPRRGDVDGDGVPELLEGP